MHYKVTATGRDKKENTFFFNAHREFKTTEELKTKFEGIHKSLKFVKVEPDPDAANKAEAPNVGEAVASA